MPLPFALFPRAVVAAMLLAALPQAADALDLEMPAPIVGVETRSEAAATYALPTAPFAAGALPTRRVEGALDQRAWRLEAKGLSLTQLASPLRAQLQAQGFTILLDCETRDCGGFDFRFAIDVMPEPAMHVDLGEFRFISAERGDEVVSLLVSRSASSGFVQLTRVGPESLPAPVPALVPAAEVPTADAPLPEPEVAPLAPSDPADPVDPVDPPEDLAGQLEAMGSAALDDLVFDSGSATLEDGNYASLAALADWLKADPARRVALVGHTDSSGGQAANIALSKKRADAVRQVLMMRLEVRPAQVVAEGVGPLAPRATNQTEAGRMKNRRVEVVVTSTQ